ncbi:MAG: hypothetical protein ACLTR6_16920 [Clostridium fessum]
MCLLSGNPNPALDAELSTTADLMNGRIVLVDDSFKILKDTFGLSRGKTLVVSDVLKAFDGETSSYLNQKKKVFLCSAADSGKKHGCSADRFGCGSRKREKYGRRAGSPSSDGIHGKFGAFAGENCAEDGIFAALLCSVLF